MDTATSRTLLLQPYESCKSDMGEAHREGRAFLGDLRVNVDTIAPPFGYLRPKDYSPTDIAPTKIS